MPSQSISVASAFCIVLPLIVTALTRLASSSAVYLTDTQLKNAVSNGGKKELRVSKLLEKPTGLELSVRLFSVISLCISLTAIYYIVFAVESIPNIIGVVALLLWPLLFWSVAVESPKRLAGYFPASFAFSYVGLFSLVCTLMKPFVLFCDLISSVTIIISGKNPKEKPHSVTEEEIRMLVDEGEEHGTIEVLERQMINNIFEFGDRDVSEVMTHRIELIAVPINATLSDIASIAIESGYSRIPVYSEDIDNICGIIYVKDLFKYIVGDSSEFILQNELRKPLFVPENSSCAQVFNILKNKKTQIAVIVDEYGGTYGIVTMEDLLETIFGNIEDEYDNEVSEITLLEDGSYLLDGSLGLSELEQLLEIKISEESDADTIGGFITELLGGVPKSDSCIRTVSFGGIDFYVTAYDDRRIIQLKAQVISDLENS